MSTASMPGVAGVVQRTRAAALARAETEKALAAPGASPAMALAERVRAMPDPTRPAGVAPPVVVDLPDDWLRQSFALPEQFEGDTLPFEILEDQDFQVIDFEREVDNGRLDPATGKPRELLILHVASLLETDPENHHVRVRCGATVVMRIVTKWAESGAQLPLAANAYKTLTKGSNTMWMLGKPTGTGPLNVPGL